MFLFRSIHMVIDPQKILRRLGSRDKTEVLQEVFNGKCRSFKHPRQENNGDYRGGDENHRQQQRAPVTQFVCR